MNNINTTIAAFQYSLCLSHRIFVYVKVSAVCLKFSLNYYLLTYPFLTELFNRSLERGVVPTTFQAAYITPLLKKSDLEPDDVKSYRPISNCR